MMGRDDRTDREIWVRHLSGPLPDVARLPLHQSGTRRSWSALAGVAVAVAGSVAVIAMVWFPHRPPALIPTRTNVVKKLEPADTLMPRSYLTP